MIMAKFEYGWMNVLIKRVILLSRIASISLLLCYIHQLHQILVCHQGINSIIPGTGLLLLYLAVSHISKSIRLCSVCVKMYSRP